MRLLGIKFRDGFKLYLTECRRCGWLHSGRDRNPRHRCVDQEE